MYQSPTHTMEGFQQLETLLANDFPSAKSQLQRHISNSTSYKRRSARISKPSSAGSSPQDYQRRRHTTSQSIPRQRRNMYQQCLRTPPSSQLLSSARPVSWHPSTMMQQPVSTISMTAYPYGVPTPITHVQTTLPLQRGWYNPEDPSGFYQQSSDYDLYRNTDATPGDYCEQTSAVFSPVVYSATLQGHLSTYSTYTAPATPDFLSVPEDTMPQQQSLPRTDSKELIGMGLYDDPDRNSWTLDNYIQSSDLTRPLSLGKGLKLEETWEPPEEDDDKTDDEEEDADHIEEDQPVQTLQQQLEQVAREAPRIPPMSTTNQTSFFFETQQALNAQAAHLQHHFQPVYGTMF